jgi:hypothetical protein
MDGPLSPNEERNADESLADMPPHPVDKFFQDHGSLVGGALKGTLMLGVLGAGAFVLLMGFTTSCAGATRSSKLKWEQRQNEIEQAEHDAQSVAHNES